MIVSEAATQTPAALLRIADILETGCLITDSELVVRGWNHWLESASGIVAQKAVGSRLADILSLEDDSIAIRSLQRALAGESVVLSHQFHEFMLPLQPTQGFARMEHMQQSARVIPYTFIDGSTGAVALIQDVTERVEREWDLNEARERAESGSKAKSEFLAAISHELRTPLTAILGYADLLQSEIGGTLNQLQHDHIGRITAGTWHLIKIIDEILSFSRVEAQKYEVSLEQVDVGALIREAMGMLQPQAAAKKIGLREEMPDHAVVTETDALKLRQILFNVIGNAIKFTDTGTVTVKLDADEAAVYCRVADSGPGVPQPMQSLIFEPFVQADQTATRAKGGTGLGLALSRGLAELLGGSLTLEQTDSSGSVFLVRLPLRSAELRHSNVGDIDAAVGSLEGKRNDLIRS